MWTVNQLGTATNGTDTEIRVELNREHYHGDKTKFDIFKVTVAGGIIRREMLKSWLNFEDAVDLVNRLVDKLNEREEIVEINDDDPLRLDKLAAYKKAFEYFFAWFFAYYNSTEGLDGKSFCDVFCLACEECDAHYPNVWVCTPKILAQFAGCDKQ